MSHWKLGRARSKDISSLLSNSIAHNWVTEFSITFEYDYTITILSLCY